MHDKIIAAQDAAKMLIAAFCDVEQTFDAFANMDIDDEPTAAPNKWIPVSERVPDTDNELVIVRTDSGAMMFASTIGGRFFRNVTDWFPLPK